MSIYKIGDKVRANRRLREPGIIDGWAKDAYLSVHNKEIGFITRVSEYNGLIYAKFPSTEIDYKWSESELEPYNKPTIILEE